MTCTPDARGFDPARRQLLRGLAAGSALGLPGLIAACHGGDGSAISCEPFSEAVRGLDAAPGSETLLTLAEMERNTQALLKSAPELVQAQVLGNSRSGRPIRLVSIGEGPRSALVVGAPHPNEPVGCVTIERLIDRLVRDPDLRNQLGFRWHFIKAIDPDGIAMNESWFRGPRTPARYLAGFYRPAMRLQPEYSFPLSAGSYRFDASTPENQCWQTALELTRPQLQCSLHNADLGGAFFLVSRDLPGLSCELAALPAQAGVSLNRAGEPFAEIAPLLPGVFSFPDLRAMVTQVADRGLKVEDFWNAGCSSAEFSTERYGTFNMTCEVPLWQESPASPGDRCRGIGIIEEQLRVGALTLKLLARQLPLLEPLVRSDDERRLYDALADNARQLAGMGPRLERLRKIKRLQGFAPLALQRGLGITEANLEPLSCQIRAMSEQTMMFANARAWAMLVRLADSIGAGAAKPDIDSGRGEAAELISSSLAKLEGPSPLRPVPLPAITAIQMSAVLESARGVASGAIV